MSAETILCRRCGAENAAGDQFCGTCGAFLEWEGEALEGPLAPLPVSAAPSAPAAGEVVCHACGRPNPPARTFCQSCGTRLRHEATAGAAASPTARPTPAPPPARPAPGPAAVPGTRAAPPGPAPVAPAPVRAREPAPSRPSGGVPGWLPVVVVLGILAGVGFVAASTFLRTPDVPSGASSAPGTPPATLTPTLPPASPGESGAVASGTPPPAGVALTMTGASASSVIGDREEFQPGKVIDGELTTCWQEGAQDEAGEWIEVTLEPSLLDYVVIYSGYQLSHDAFLANLRPKDVTVSVNGGTPQAFVLGDTELPQRVDFADVSGATTVRITLLSTYDSQASAYPGSPFDDTAISEIRAFGTPGG
jgi:Double zinc ribbon